VCQKVKCAMLSMSGVQSIETTPVTGSILVRYDPDRIYPHTLINSLRTLGVLEGVIGFPTRRYALAPPRAKPVGARVPRSALTPFAEKIVFAALKVFVPMLIERVAGRTAGKLIATIL